MLRTLFVVATVAVLARASLWCRYDEDMLNAGTLATDPVYLAARTSANALQAQMSFVQGSGVNMGDGLVGSNPNNERGDSRRFVSVAYTVPETLWSAGSNPHIQLVRPSATCQFVGALHTGKPVGCSDDDLLGWASIADAPCGSVNVSTSDAIDHEFETSPLFVRLLSTDRTLIADAAAPAEVAAFACLLPMSGELVPTTFDDPDTGVARQYNSNDCGLATFPVPDADTGLFNASAWCLGITDCDEDGVADMCQGPTATTPPPDDDGDGYYNFCNDCNSNGIVDRTDIVTPGNGFVDVDNNGIIDGVCE